jgi:DNA anti-recombination protein RmuC
MATIASNKRAIPGVVNVQQRIVTRETTRTKAVRNQTLLDIDSFRELSQAMKELKEEMEAVRGRLLHTMQATQQQKLLSSDGTFAITLKERSSWSYSDELEDRLTMLKADQQIEQRKGIAINTPTVYIDGRTVTA